MWFSNPLASPRLCLLAAASLLSASLGSAQSVLTVDPGAAGAFPTISSAIAAAASNDIILVKPATYVESLTISQPVSIFADGAVLVRGSMNIAPTSDGDYVVRGLEFLISLGEGPVEIQSESARVFLEDVVVTNGNLGQFGMDPDAVIVRFGSNQVALTRCTLKGSLAPIEGGDGLRAEDQTTLAFYDCDLQGGDGGIGPNDGGDGAELLAGTNAYMSGSVFRGGAGGAGVFTSVGGCVSGGSGGSGMDASQANDIFRLNSGFVGGAAGNAFPGCSTGVAGLGFLAPMGTLTDYVGKARHFRVDPVTQAGTTSNWTWDGLQGDGVFAAFTQGPFAVILGIFKGCLFYPVLPGNTVVGGVLPASGSLTVGQPTPALPPGTGMRPGIQGFFIEGPGNFFLAPISFAAIIG